MNIDTIYNDFTTKVLPQIQSGLTITKEYFVDLFGRYIKYLIITDSIYIGIIIIILIIAILLLIKGIKMPANGFKHYDGTVDWHPAKMFLVVLSIFSILMCIYFLSINTSNLIKDIYIPEIRIIDEIKNYQNCTSI